MRDSIQDIDDRLNRLACLLAIGGEEGRTDADETRGALVAALEGSDAPGLGEVVARARAVSQAGDGAGADAAVDALAEAWARWKRGEPDVTASDPGTEAPAPAEAPSADLDADVASLAVDLEMAAMFIAEALDHLGTIETTVLALEGAPEDVKLLNDVFRPFHTIKGNAGALGVTTVQELAHHVENLLDRARSGKHRMRAAEFDLVLRAVDVLTAYMHELSARLAGGGGVDLEPRRQDLMRAVDGIVERGGATAQADRSGEFMDDTTATAADPGRAVEDAPALPAESQAASSLAWRGDDYASVKVDTRKLDSLVDMVGELVILQSIIEQDPTLGRVVDEHLTRNLGQLRRATSDLQRTAMSMRMVPVRQTFQKMGRLVRDLSRKSGKPVELVLSGEDTELDRRVVEDLNDPLMHMIRNSIDHGLEDPEARVRAGKPPKGTLSLSAYHQSGNIVMVVSDDGAGLDTERIRAKAVARGLMSSEAALSPAEIHQIIFQPGFSTAETVTEISGRGVGMDVVRSNIEALRGRVEIQSERGRGTTFLIKLPLTLAIVEGLILSVGPERFVLPTFSVRESLRPTPDQVHRVQDRPVLIQVRGRLIPLLRLADLTGVEGAQENPCEATVVVIEEDQRQLGLIVDRLLGKQEVVIKSLGAAFAGVRGVAGGAILGDGRIGLILDAHGIVGAGERESVRAA